MWWFRKSPGTRARPILSIQIYQGGVYSLALALTLALALGAPGLAQADSVDLGNGGTAAYDAKGNLTIGKNVQAEGSDNAGQNNVAIGTSTDTLRKDGDSEGQPLDANNTKLVEGEGKAAVLNRSTAASDADDNGSTAIGYKSHAEGDSSTAVGDTAKVIDTSIVYYADADGNKTTSKDDAVWYKDSSGNPTKVPQVFRDADGNTTTTAQYVHTTTTKDASGNTVTKKEITTDVSLADKDSSGNPVYNYQKSDNTDHLFSVTLYQSVKNSIAAGSHVTAAGNSAVVVGYNSTANESAVAVGDSANAFTNAVAVGKKSQATADSALAAGNGAEATGEASTAIGNGIKASADQATAVGANGTQATGVASTAVGSNATADGETSSAFGANVFAHDGGTAVGSGGVTANSSSAAFGIQSTTASGTSVAVGKAGTTASDNSVAVGSAIRATDSSYASGINGTSASGTSVAVGRNGTTASDNSMAVGSAVTATGSSYASGMSSTTASGSSYASGMNGTTAYNSSVAVGSSVHANNSSFAAGFNSSAGTNGSSWYGTNIAVGSNTSANNGSSAFGSNATADYQSLAIGLKGNNSNNAYASFNSMAIGNNANATGYSTAIGNSSSASSYSVAIGEGASAQSSNGTAVGYSSVAYRSNATALGYSARATSENATALGNGAAAHGVSAVSIGNSSNAGTYATAIGNGAGAAADNAVALGNGAGANYDYSLALGNSANAAADNAVALGSNATANEETGVAIGYSSTANVASGKTGLDPHTGAASTDTSATWVSTLGAVSVGTVDSDGNATKTRQINGVAAGTKDTDAVNLAQLKAMETKINMHYYSVNSTVTGDGSNYDNTGASGKNSMAAGPNASATAENAVAIGYGAKAEGKGAAVIGQYGKATGDYAFAFGGETTDITAEQTNNVASGTNAVSFGERTTASGSNATAFGQETTASEKRATAFGQRTTAKQSNATAFGQDTLADGQNATAFGNLTVASSYGATAFGNKNKATGQYATAWGGGDKVIGKDANGKDIKQGTVASGTYATAFGERTEASGESSTAFGSDSVASGNNSLAFGVSSLASGNNTVAGLGGTASTENSIALGKDTKANNKDNAVSVAIGQNAEASGARSLAIGFGVKGKVTEGGVEKEDNVLTQTTASGESAVAIGTDTEAAGQHSLAMGSHTEAAEDSSVAIGYDTHATKASTVAIGSGTKANRGYGVAIGLSALAGIDESDPSSSGATTFDGSQTVAMGYYARATATNAAALGAATTANINGGVALGYKSATTRAAGNMVNGVEQTAYLKPASAGSSNSTWTSTAGAVSVGNVGAKKSITRQITDVAAGSLDTDAVNVAQLKQVKNALDDAHLDFAGDQGTSSVKLNKKVTVSGGETNPGNLVSNEKNIGVVASQDGTDSKLELKLAKDIKGLNSVTAGTARLGNNPAGTLATTKNGAATGSYAEVGNYVTGLDNRSWNVTDPTYVSGRGATEDELAAVSSQVTTNKTDIASNKIQIDQNTQTIAKGLSFTTNRKDASNTSDNYKGYKVVNRKLGDTIAIKGSDAADGHTYSTKNLTTEIAENGDITVKMDEKPDFTSVSTNDVIYKGKASDTAKDNQAAKADLITYYGGKTLVDDKNVAYGDKDTRATRLTYSDAQNKQHDIATMDDGQIYAGDFTSDGKADTTGFTRTMNQKTTINGGAKKKEDLTDGNIGVVSNGKDTLTVKLNKDLQGLNSVTTGNTVINNAGLTITNTTDNSKNVVINGDTISYGGNQVNNMGSGSDGTDKDGKPTYNTITNGANIGDVQNIAKTTVQPVIDTVNAGWELDTNGQKLKDVTPTSRKANFAAGQNITITGENDTVTVATAEDVRFNTVRVGGDKTDSGYTGGIVIGKQNGGGANTNVDSYITGLKNTSWDNNNYQSGRAATEDQLHQVAEEIKGGVVASDVYVSGGGVSYSDDDPKTKNDGKGKLTLTRNNEDTLEIDGLHDYYITNGSVSPDGKTLTLTRNDLDENGQNKTISVNLEGILKNDLRLVQNPAAGSKGKYTVGQDGTVTLKVQNADGTVSNDITIGGFEGVVDHYKGLNFDANTRTTADGKVHNVKMGDTVKVQGTDPVTGHTYSADNVTTEVGDDGNITIKLDQDLKAQTVTVSGKDGKDGRIGLTGKDGKDGTVTTIIRTIGKNGTDGTNGTPGVDGKNGITRIVYQDGKDGEAGTTIHTVATLDDGLKFSGDDGQKDSTKVIAKKLNEQLDIVGGATGALTDNNIGVTNKEGKLYVQLAQNLNLGDKGSLQAGNATIGAFSNTALTTNKGNHPDAGSYATGLSNKDWNVQDPEYVSGRAATEDQLQIISKAINDSKTVRTDYQLIANPNNTTDGSYTADNGTLELTVRDTEHQNDPNYKDKTITIKDIASKSKVDEALDRTVKYDMGSDNKVDKTHITLEGGDAGTQIRNMASGASEITTDADGKKTYTYNTDTNAANIGDVKTIAGQNSTELTAKGLDFVGNNTAVKVHRDLGTTLIIQGEGSKGDDAYSGENLKVIGDANGSLTIKLDRDLTLNSTTYTSNVTGGGTSRTVVDGSGLTIDNGPSITNKGIDAGSQVISNVADGQAPTDAVNVSQLTKVEQKAGQHSSVEAGASGNITVTPGTNAAGGTKYTVDLANNVNFGEGDKQISINGDNGTVTIGQGDKQIKLDSQDGSISAGGVTINKDNKGTVNGLTNKEWDGEHITSGQAATEDQLQKVEQNVNNKVDKVAKQHTTVSVNGGNAAGNLVMQKTAETDEKGANYDISLSNDVTLGSQGENGKDGRLTVTSQDGTKAITANGQDGTLTFKDGTKKTTIKAAEAAKGVDGKTDIQRVAVDNHTVATLDDGMKFAGDSGEALQQKLNSTTNIKGGATGELTDGNIGVVSDGKDTLTVKLAKDITGLNSIETKTVNTNTVNIAGDSSHSAITIKQGDVNMGGNTISGVAPGKVSADSTEAINGSQLYARDQAIGKLGNSVNRLDNKINRAGAGAAALAALHPQDFDPDDKWDFAAGYGNYHGASAAAIGAFYRPTEDVMVSVGGSMGGGENMVNAGVTFKLGQHNHVSNSRVAMAKEIRDLKATVGQLTQMVNQLTGNTGGKTLPLQKGDTLFPDVPKNHWAYDYVTKLAQAGLLEGYPDGEFKGDRMMTRYEFATVIYRAIMAGAAGNPKLNQDGTLDKLVDEFGDELQYICIAVVERDKNGKPTIERVRTVEDDKKHHHQKEANA